MIFTDIVDVGIEELRQNMEYILVYNENINFNSKDAESDVEKKSYVQKSPALNQIAKTFASYSNDEHVLFGLKSFENYCFRKVHTYTKEEFEKFLSSVI